jgi:hypothetical protein
MPLEISDRHRNWKIAYGDEYSQHPWRYNGMYGNVTAYLGDAEAVVWGQHGLIKRKFDPLIA